MNAMEMLKNKMKGDVIVALSVIAYCTMLYSTNAALYIGMEEGVERFKGTSKRLEGPR
jgi:hypothetical protein